MMCPSWYCGVGISMNIWNQKKIVSLPNSAHSILSTYALKVEYLKKCYLAFSAPQSHSSVLYKAVFNLNNHDTVLKLCFWCEPILFVGFWHTFSLILAPVIYFASEDVLILDRFPRCHATLTLHATYNILKYLAACRIQDPSPTTHNTSL